MTSMTIFILAALALLAMVFAILLPPLLRKPKAEKANDQRDANLRIFRDQIAELERERAEGSLAEADFAQSLQELQRRLLDEVDTTVAEIPASQSSFGRYTALALLVFLSLGAGLGYLLLGAPQAINTPPVAMHPDGLNVQTMLERLAARLEAHPDDGQGWVMLARSYRALGRFAEATNAYEKASALDERNPALLADYAEVRAQANGGAFAGQPDELIERALQLDPDEPNALFLAGVSAKQRQDFPAVDHYWNRLLRQLAPESEEARSLQEAIDQAHATAKGKE